MAPPSSARTSTITTSTGGTSSTTQTFTSVSSFLPPRAEQRIHIWLSEVSAPSYSHASTSSSASTPFSSDGGYDYEGMYAQPTLHHGRLSVAQIYATKEKGPSLSSRIKKLGRFGRKDKVFGFDGERVGGDVRAKLDCERTGMYGLDVAEMAPRASFAVDGQVTGDGGDDVVRMNGSDFGAGIVGDRRLDRRLEGERRHSAYLV